MRVNIYAEADRIEIVEKEVDGHKVTGVRFRGPFIHRKGDDDSAAVTFWGKRDARDCFNKALALLDDYCSKSGSKGEEP